MTEAVPEIPGPHLSPTFVWVELSRRIDANQARLDRLDEHGSRGVDALREQVTRLRQDLIDHEGMHQRAADEVATARRWLIGIVIALITPLYPLIIWILTKGQVSS